MKRNPFKTDRLLFRIWLLFQLCIIGNGSAVDTIYKAAETEATDLKRCDETSFNNRMTNVKAINEKQDREIKDLTNQLEEEREFSKKLSGRLSQLEASVIPSSMHSDKLLLERSKRPFRLLPPNIPMEKEKTNDAKNLQFYGPATNCNDLALLGYTLNGYYLIKTSSHHLNKNEQIGAVYCNFQQKQGNKQPFETLIGNVFIKTKSVYFYVQRNSSFTQENAIIPFELVRLNEGGAMNLASGIFTVPVTGLYHFEFSGNKESSTIGLHIDLQVKGENVGRSATHYSTSGSYGSVSLTAFLRLKANDRVNLYNAYGTLFDDVKHHTHFIGWLVEEDLM